MHGPQSSSSSAAGEFPKGQLTAEKLLAVLHENCPLHRLARQLGADLDAGDELVFPRAWLEKLPELELYEEHPKVHFSEHADKCYVFHQTKTSKGLEPYIEQRLKDEKANAEIRPETSEAPL